MALPATLVVVLVPAPVGPAGPAVVRALAGPAGPAVGAPAGPATTPVASLVAGRGATGSPAVPLTSQRAGRVTGAGRGVWPVRPAIVLRGFQAPSAPWGRGHRGIDLMAPRGRPVRSAAAGVVTFAALLAGRGVVVVRHGALRTTYEPLLPVVGAGDDVAAGQVIGTVSAGAGHCGGDPPCLHWGLRRDDAYLDPRLLLVPVRPVLRPPRGP